MTKQSLRVAQDSDIDVIESWLPRAPGVESLYMNWNLALDEHRAGRLYVWDDEAGGLPIAYTWGTVNSTGSVLEVHPAYRGRGIGKAIATELIERARAGGEPLLQIQCAPPSSQPFWESMGFRIYGRRYIGRQIIRIPQEVPDGPAISVMVEFHRESYLHGEPRPAPISVHQPTARLGADGRLHFDELVAQFDPEDDRDLVVRIVVQGKEVFADKAKYDEARDYGILRCRNGFKLGWTGPHKQAL